jgi:hypothetical protein
LIRGQHPTPAVRAGGDQARAEGWDQRLPRRENPAVNFVYLALYVVRLARLGALHLTAVTAGRWPRPRVFQVAAAGPAEQLPALGATVGSHTSMMSSAAYLDLRTPRTG